MEERNKANVLLEFATVFQGGKGLTAVSQKCRWRHVPQNVAATVSVNHTHEPATASLDILEFRVNRWRSAQSLTVRCVVLMDYANMVDVSVNLVMISMTTAERLMHAHGEEKKTRSAQDMECAM